ncbi:hypothetical protein VPH5P1C_0120 [Vibrio phage 5P1c]
MTTINTVMIIDEDKLLSNTPELVIVKKFEDVIIPEGEDSMMTLLNLAIEHDFKKILGEHNEKRSNVVNPQTLERTGKKVYLQPVKIQDLTVKIK